MFYSFSNFFFSSYVIFVDENIEIYQLVFSIYIYIHIFSSFCLRVLLIRNYHGDGGQTAKYLFAWVTNFRAMELCRERTDNS